jgi:hypothetical protein
MPRGGNCNCDKGMNGGQGDKLLLDSGLDSSSGSGVLGGKRKANKPRKLSEYNKFMKKEIPLVKKNNPKLSHMEAFKKAAGNWKNR